jgi:ribosomal protein L29
MATPMTDLANRTDAELHERIEAARTTIREERFKDKFSRKASVIRNAKLDIARAMTTLSSRRQATKN